MNEKAEKILRDINAALDDFHLTVKENPENIRFAKERLKADVERIFKEGMEGNQEHLF